MKKIRTFEGLPIVYQNKRVVIMEATSGIIFSNNHQFILRDKYTSIDIGWADQLPDGSYKGVTFYGPHDIFFTGQTLNELAINGLYEHKWIMSQ
jgi:hypothetical protein